MHEATLTVLNTMNTSNCCTSSNTFQMIVIMFYSISYSLYVINNVSWESDITCKKDKRPRCNFCSDISFKGGAVKILPTTLTQRKVMESARGNRLLNLLQHDQLLCIFCTC